jgi:NAD/NADP transhydrogenase alpha subunit
MNAETRDNIKFFAILAAVGFVTYKLATKLGLVKTASDIQAEKDVQALDSGAALNPKKVDLKNPAVSLNPKYWLTIVNAYTKKLGVNGLTQKQFNAVFNPDLSNGKGYHQNLTNFATQVWDSKQVFFLPDKEDRTYNVFRTMRNQAQVSKLAATFSELYKRDLLGFIQSFMNDEQQSKLFKILQTKPLI